MSKERIMQYLPEYYQNSRVMGAIAEAQGTELDMLYTALDEILKQFFIDTATWGLRYWEEMCGLPVNEQEPLENRRARVLAKLRSFPSARHYDILNVIKSFVKSGRVDLAVYPGEYRFVAILAAEAKANVPGILAAIEEARPAHMAFSLILAILSRYVVAHERRVTWHVPVISGIPSSIRRLDKYRRIINGGFRLNNTVTLAPIPGLSGWALLDGQIKHSARYNFQSQRQMGEVRTLGVSPDYLDTRYKLDGRFNLDYQVQDTRWFLDGTASIGYMGSLTGGLSLNGAWSLNFARRLDGEIVIEPRHFLVGFGDAPLHAEHRQLNGAWNIGKTLVTHRLAWVKWCDGLVIERGLVS